MTEQDLYAIVERVMMPGLDPACASFVRVACWSAYDRSPREMRDHGPAICSIIRTTMDIPHIVKIVHDRKIAPSIFAEEVVGLFLALVSMNPKVHGYREIRDIKSYLGSAIYEFGELLPTLNKA